jgi:hypothetical protein
MPGAVYIRMSLAMDRISSPLRYMLTAACTTAAIAGLVWWAIRPMEWRPHLLSLLGRAFDSFTKYLGTNGPGWVVSVLLSSFVTIIFSILLIGFLRGAAEMKKHWIETASIGMLCFLGQLIVLYAPIYLRKVVRTAYTDHQDLVDNDRNLRASTSHLVDPKSRDDEITALKKQLRNARVPVPPTHSKELREVFPRFIGMGPLPAPFWQPGARLFTLRFELPANSEGRADGVQYLAYSQIVTVPQIGEATMLAWKAFEQIWQDRQRQKEPESWTPGESAYTSNPQTVTDLDIQKLRKCEAYNSCEAYLFVMGAIQWTDEAGRHQSENCEYPNAKQEVFVAVDCPAHQYQTKEIPKAGTRLY